MSFPVNERMYDCVRVGQRLGVVDLIIYRPEANNSINRTLVKEIVSVIKESEYDQGIKVIVLSGLKDNFCTGMDFGAFDQNHELMVMEDDANGYYEMLKMITLCSKIIVAKVEGKVNAGGVGLVAASDIVISDGSATFGLSEALFGLLPACVMPFLIRRVGYQKALWMTLSTQGISAERAYQIGLVDEVSENVDETLRKSLLRLTRLETELIKDLKQYMSKLWIMNDQTQELAVDKISSLINSKQVQSNLRNYVQNGKFPWDK